MPTNLELKAAITSVAAAHETALKAGGRFLGTMRQTDTYFLVSHGRLKLREIEGQTAELIAYDRPETEQVRWSRYVKSPVVEPVVLRRMLSDSLGVLATVRKTRELFILEESRIHLDDVETLGVFLEFEVPVGGKDPEDARQTMERLRTLFAVRESDVLLNSYSDLVLSRRTTARTRSLS